VRKIVLVSFIVEQVAAVEHGVTALMISCFKGIFENWQSIYTSFVKASKHLSVRRTGEKRN